MNRVDLIWLGNPEHQPTWSLGEVWPTNPNPAAIHRMVREKLPTSLAQAWLFWDSALGVPEGDIILKAMTRPGDLWHAGLRLGTGGLPGLIDFVAPTWMLNRDPPADIEATSWRISLRCCLISIKVLRQMGSVHQEFITLDGSALEMGHRYVKHGVITRYLPWLFPHNLPSLNSFIIFEDELRFIYYRFGRIWAKWALMRALITKYASLGTVIKSWRKIGHSPRLPNPSPLIREHHPLPSSTAKSKVSVLIPTLDRYDYLRNLLRQIEHQTIKPVEIIIIDQTAQAKRDYNLIKDFSELPLTIIYLDQPGQCSARNAGLKIIKSDFVLFVDDDDEVTPQLIEKHLDNLRYFNADTSSGVAHEIGAGPLPSDFTYIRASDVFPTNNTLLYRRVLERSGLFDMAYDKGIRADGDLGMRIYLSGALMVLNPEIPVLHHRAPKGGLRIHKARVITYASSRRYLTQRHLPSKTEIYLAKRYFTSKQVQQDWWLTALGTFSIRGSWVRRALKILIGAVLLPHTCKQIKIRNQEADRMLLRYPKISWFSSSCNKES
jgi:glycosyltransferase involved in cell wall biosynthesis